MIYYELSNSLAMNLCSEIEREYLEDEEWHQKMVEYLAKATKEYTQLDEQLSRVGTGVEVFCPKFSR